MKHLDLFSGIGGASLAMDWVFGKENVEHIFCENDAFCQRVLKKHWPHSKIHDDIKKLDATKIKPDIVTGGFPCQPFSQAGKRKGKEDDRDLWPQMARVIAESKPTWVVGENVAGFVGMELDRTLSDLAREGYEAIPFVIPAVAVNAPHRRDRVWIIAHAKHYGQYGAENAKGDSAGSERNPKRTDKLRQLKRSNSLRAETPDWNQNWLEVATRLCRMDDGLSKGLYRRERLKALGNAWVPQLAVQIFKAIKEEIEPCH